METDIVQRARWGSREETLDDMQRLLEGSLIDTASLRYIGRLDKAGSWPASAGAPF